MNMKQSFYQSFFRFGKVISGAGVIFFFCSAFQFAFAVPNTTLAADTDPEIFQQLSPAHERTSDNCGGSSVEGVCRYKAMQRFNNPRIEGEKFKVDIELRAGQAPETTNLAETTRDNPSNLLHTVSSNLYHGGAAGAFGDRPESSGTCAFIERPAVLNGPYSFDPINGNFAISDVSPQTLAYAATGSGGFTQPPSARRLERVQVNENLAFEATAFVLPHEDWFRWITLECMVTATTQVAGLSFSGESFKLMQQLGGINESSFYAVYLANNLEYYPLDGTSAYIEHAELSDDGTKAYVRFNSGEESNQAFPAGYNVETAANYQMISADGQTAVAATGVTRLGNNALWLDFGTGFATAPAANAAVYIHAGFPGQNAFIADAYSNASTYRVAYHGADYATGANGVRIVSAEVSAGSQYVEVTFNQRVSRLAKTLSELTADDFVLEYFSSSEAAGESISATAVEKISDSVYRVNLPYAGFGTISGNERLIIRGSSLVNANDNKYYATNANIFGADNRVAIDIPADATTAPEGDGDYGLGARALFGNGMVGLKGIPTATISADNLSITEGEMTTVTVTRGGDINNQSTLMLAFMRPGNDDRQSTLRMTVPFLGSITDLPAGTEHLVSSIITFAPGVSGSFSFVFWVNDDADSQGARGFRFVLSRGEGDTATDIIGSPLIVTVADNDDAVPPTLPNKGVEIIHTGATSATLRVTAALDTDGAGGGSNVNYYIRITDMTDGNSSQVVVIEKSRGQDISGTKVDLNLDRNNVVLIPERAYRIQIGVADVGGNGLDDNGVPTSGLTYNEVTLTMESVADNDMNEDGYADDLKVLPFSPSSASLGDLSAYCGGFGDADGDGISNQQELLTGTDCRIPGLANGFDDSALFAGSGDAPMLTVNNSIELLNHSFKSAAGAAAVVLFNEPSTERVTCAGAGGSECTLSAHTPDEYDACPLPDSICNIPNLYDSETGELTVPTAGKDESIVWVMRDSKGNARSAEQTVYVATGVTLSGRWQLTAGQTYAQLYVNLHVDGKFSASAAPNDFLKASTPRIIFSTAASVPSTRNRIAATITEALDAGTYSVEVNPGAWNLEVKDSDELRGLSNDGSSERNFVTVRGNVPVTVIEERIPPSISRLELSRDSATSIVTLTYAIFEGGYASSVRTTANLINPLDGAVLLSVGDDEEAMINTATTVLQVVSSITYTSGAGEETELIRTFDYELRPSVGVVPAPLPEAVESLIPEFYEEMAHGSVGFSDTGAGGLALMNPVELSTELRTSYYVYKGNAYCEFTEGPDQGQLYSALSCAGSDLAMLSAGLVTGYTCVVAEVVDGGPNDPDGMQDGVVSLTAAVGPIGIAPPCSGTIGGGGGGGGSADLWTLALLVSLMSGLLWRNRRCRILGCRSETD